MYICAKCTQAPSPKLESAMIWDSVMSKSQSQMERSNQEMQAQSLKIKVTEKFERMIQSPKYYLEIYKDSFL